MSEIKNIRLHHTDLNAYSLGFLITKKAMIKVEHNYIDTFVIDNYLQEKFNVKTTSELYEKTKVVIKNETYVPPFWQVIYHVRCKSRLVQVEIDGHWGFANIDTGELINEAKWDFCEPFSNGYAVVWESCPGEPGARGINKPGNVFVDKNDWYKYPWNPTNTRRCGYIDETGKVIVPVMYQEGKNHVENDSFIAKFSTSGWGVVNKENVTVVNFDWTYLERVTKAEGKWDGYCGYSNLKSKKYFKYNVSGQFLGSFLFKKEFDKSICFKIEDKEIRFLEKSGMLYSIQEGVVSKKTYTWEEIHSIISECFETYNDNEDLIFEKSTKFKYTDKEYTVIEKDNSFKLFVNEKQVYWPNNWHDLLDMIKNEQEETIENNSKPSLQH